MCLEERRRRSSCDEVEEWYHVVVSAVQQRSGHNFYTVQSTTINDAEQSCEMLAR